MVPNGSLRYRPLAAYLYTMTSFKLNGHCLQKFKTTSSSNVRPSRKNCEKLLRLCRDRVHLSADRITILSQTLSKAGLLRPKKRLDGFCPTPKIYKKYLSKLFKIIIPGPLRVIVSCQQKLELIFGINTVT